LATSPVRTSSRPAAALSHDVTAVGWGLDALETLACSGCEYLAPQHSLYPGSPHPLAARYARANPVLQRRFEAELRAAEALARMALMVLARRPDKSFPASRMAAHFLGKQIEAALARLDELVASVPG